jgi:hypothetical protein
VSVRSGAVTVKAWFARGLPVTAMVALAVNDGVNVPHLSEERLKKNGSEALPCASRTSTANCQVPSPTSATNEGRASEVDESCAWLPDGRAIIDHS